MLWLKQSTAASVIVGPVLDSAGVEYASAVIGDLSLSKNGGSLTALASAATLTYIANGYYTLAMTTGNADTLGRAQVSVNKATYQMPPVEFQVLPATVYDALVANATTAAGGLGDIQRMSGTVLTARDIGASVLLSSGTGTGQLDFTSGVVKANAVQLLGTAWLTPGTAGTPDVNAKLAGGTAWNSGAITASTVATDAITSTGLATSAVQEIRNAITGGAYALDTDSNGRVRIVDGTAAGELDTTSGLVTLAASQSFDNAGQTTNLPANVKAFLATALTETSAGYLTAAFKKLFDVATPVLTAASVNQTGDSYARLGAPAGASHAADVAAIQAVTDALSPLLPGSGTLATTTNITTVAAVNGNVGGSVFGDVLGGLAGNVSGSVLGSVAGNVNGKLLGGGSGTITGTGCRSDLRAWNGTAPSDLISGRVDAIVGAMQADVMTSAAAAASFGTEIQALVTGGAYALNTDASGNVKISDGTGANQIDTTSGAIARVTLVDTVTTNTDMLTAAGVWAAGTRTLSAGTNIVLAKGVGVTGFTDLSAAAVNAEVVDALSTDTYAEPGQGTPAATASIKDKVGWLFASWRNRKTNDGTTTTLYADDATTVIAKQTTSKSGDVLEKAEWITGP